MSDHCHSRYTPCGMIVTYICYIIKMEKENTDGGLTRFKMCCLYDN
jgi:hypothetical protein